MDDFPIVVKNELDCWQEDAPICPYCGKEQHPGDFDWLGEESGHPVDCFQCSEVFFLDKVIKVTYTTIPYQGWDGVRINKGVKPDETEGLH